MRRLPARARVGRRRRGPTPATELLADERTAEHHAGEPEAQRHQPRGKAGQRSRRRAMVVEKCSHVMHIVSNVVGERAPDKDAFDVLRACLPAGTVSGAPKVRAMEIIEELEPTRRGPYAGAIGYFSFSGNMDTCITIRTLALRDGVAYLQAGAGIVADSVPAKEYEETVNKARALLRAIEVAENGL